MKKLSLLSTLLTILFLTGCANKTINLPKNSSNIEKELEASFDKKEPSLPPKPKKQTAMKYDLKVEVYEGKIGLKDIENNSFTLMNKEAKEVCFLTKESLPKCFWVGYKNNKIYWNLKPKENMKYSNNYFDSSFKVDRDTFVLPVKAKNGLFSDIFFFPHKRGEPLDLRFFVKTRD